MPDGQSGQERQRKAEHIEQAVFDVMNEQMYQLYRQQSEDAFPAARYVRGVVRELNRE